MKWIFLFLLSITCKLSAQNISDSSWLAGTWTGEGFGGTMEEIWSIPDKNGVMIGMFRHENSTKATFYEFWTFIPEKGIFLKHFNPDLSGWEEKNEFITFPLIQITSKKLELEGLTYELINADTLKITLQLEENGTIQTEIFQLHKRS